MADSFVENPFVSSVGNALGLGALGFDPGGGSPESNTPPNTTLPKPPLPPDQTEKLRVSKQVRQNYPTAKAGAATRGSTPGGLPGFGLPGVLSPDVYNHPVVQQLLNQYGVTPEQAHNAVMSASPNMFITNPEAYQKHPVLAGMLERGLEGAAFTQGSKTWGEGISNVAKGALDAQGARAEKYNNQLMMPFAQASTIQGMKSNDIKDQYELAQAKRSDAMATYYDDRPELLRQLNQIKQEHEDNLKQQAKQHKTMGLVLMQSKMPPLNAEEQAAVDATIPEGGTMYDADPDVLQKAMFSAHQRFTDEQNKAALNRVTEANKGKVAAAAASSTGHVDNSTDQRSFTNAVDNWKATDKYVADFDRGGPHFVDIPNADGTGTEHVLSTSTKGKTYRQILIQKRDAAAKAKDMLAGPRGNNTAAPVRMRTMNLDGSISDN